MTKNNFEKMLKNAPQAKPTKEEEKIISKYKNADDSEFINYNSVKESKLKSALKELFA